VTLLETGRSATLIRPARVEDRRGDTVNDWADVERRDLPGAWIQQTSTTEVRDERTVTVTRWTLFCTDPDIREQDRVEWREEFYEVDGRPTLVEGFRGYHHTEAPLVLLEGS
jgi:hypothetical protein